MKDLQVLGDMAVRGRLCVGKVNFTDSFVDMGGISGTLATGWSNASVKGTYPCFCSIIGDICNFNIVFKCTSAISMETETLIMSNITFGGRKAIMDTPLMFTSWGNYYTSSYDVWIENNNLYMAIRNGTTAHGANVAFGIGGTILLKPAE